MSNLLKLVTPILVLLIVPASHAFADSPDDFAGEAGASQTAPKYQIGFGLDYRIDELDYRDYVPSVNAHFWYGLNQTIALRGGVSHNSFTRVLPATSFHEVALDLGLRLYFTPRSVTPFIETGIHLPFYWGVDWGHEFDDFHPGIRLAAGLALDLSRSAALDFTVSQILNHVRKEVVLASPIPPIGGTIGYSRDEPTVGYNATRVALALRLGI